jgi:hypothetical protein
VCVSTPFGEPLGQRHAVDSPCGSSSVVTRDASDQFLPSHVFVRAPVPRRLPGGRTLARPPPEIPSASRQDESLRWVSRGPSSGFHRVGRCLPVAMRENRTSDTPVASCPEPVELALLTLSNRPPRPPRSARVNDANRWTIQGAFHRSRTFAPQRPLGRPAPDLARPVAWPPRFPLPTPLHPASPFGISRELGRRPRGPVASGDHASLGLGRRSPTSATVSTYGHALRAADPRTRVELSPRCSPGTNRCQVASVSPVRCRTGDLRAATRSRRLSLRRAPLARTRRITGRGARAKAWFARSCDDAARALLVTPRAPGSPARFASRSG